MLVKRKLIPGQSGTKRWKKKFGDDLVCVRYRYDELLQKKVTTVEIIVEQSIWEKRPHKIPGNKIMSIRVNYGELKISGIVKKAGGRWNSKEKVWKLAYKDVMALGLEKRIVNASAKSNRHTI
jgi:hypothetical protein